MARIGYFGEKNLDPIKQELDALRISYTVVVRPEIKEEALEEVKSPEAKELHLEPRFYEVEVADDEVSKMDHILKEYEIFELSDGKELENEDHICPRCEFTLTFPCTCPKCQLELLTFSDFVAARKASQLRNSSPARIFYFLIFVAFFYYILHKNRFL